MKLLILGATGFIGSTVTCSLLAQGHDVTGLGRSIAHAQRKFPTARWINRDLASLTTAKDWQALIAEVDAIINCAGALQDGLSDDLEATQNTAMQALYQAASASVPKLIIQVSARTDGAASSSPFLATKRAADEALVASGLPYVIVRPALVIGRNSHGGTSLIRALSSIPYVTTLVFADSPVQTIAVDDVARVIAKAIEGEIPSGSDIYLAAPERLTLEELVGMHRQWLGLPPAKVVRVPALLAKPVTWLADLAGQFGWRSPLRSTAMSVMSQGVTMEERSALPHGLVPETAEQTLGKHPAGVQDLWAARLYLLKPAIILCLSLFWLLSGLIPLIQPSRAASHFLPFMAYPTALFITLATCMLDIALGVAVLFRPFVRKAMIGMLAVTASYLVGGSLLEPGLWLDPLGPLVKVLPSVALTFTALAILDER